MRPKTLVLPLLLAAFALVAAAGCGGGSSRNTAYAGSKADFASAMSSICGPVVQQIKQLSITNEAEIVSKGPQVVDIERKAIDKIDGLQPPDEIKDAVEDWVSRGRDGVKKTEDLIDAVKNKDASKVKQLETELTDIDRQTDEDARTIGASACLQNA